MKKGVSINIGVNTLNSDFYQLILDQGLSLGYLDSPTFDAVKLGEIARKIGFKIKPPRSGTSKDPNFAEDKFYLNRIEVKPVLDAIRETSKELTEEGSFLLITFSGHGMKIPQILPTDISLVDTVIPAEASWCFYDRPMLDDELTDVLSEFAEGVRIVIISDSCYSGTVLDKSLFGLIGENIDNLNLQALEKAVLRAKGFTLELNESETDESKRTVTILNHPDTIKIRKENIDKLQETHFRERIRKVTIQDLLNKGMTKDEIESFLDKINIKELDKNLNIFTSNKLMIKTIQNDNDFLKGLSKIDLKDKTFDEFNKELDLLLNDNLIIKNLKDIPLIKNSKLIPEALAEKIYKENEPKFNELRKVARDKINIKLASGAKLIKADVIFLSACQDGESTIAGCGKDKNSEYTKAIIEIWNGENGNKFAGSYKKFQSALAEYYKTPIWEDQCVTGKTYTQIQKPLRIYNDESFWIESPMFNLT